jgi:tRNA(Ile)-lysidine synthase TilS/MesJ
MSNREGLAKRAKRSVYVVTAHGRQSLDSGDNERIFELLQRNGIPWSGVAIYTASASGGPLQLTPCLDRRLEDFADGTEIYVYFNRNVNPFIFSLAQFQQVPALADAEATEYFYQRLDNGASSASAFLKKLSPAECQSVIAERVAETIRATVPAGTDLVVGVSGGGDSNALLYALSKLQAHQIRVHPVIIMGIPDWDQGVPRARELCGTYGLDLTVMDEQEVKALLGIPADNLALIDRFEREFEGDDFEFLGTLLVRLALAKRARELGTSFICTGLNLEDILCEAMFRVSSGMEPAAFPARVIGDMTLVFPLWLCPKRIIDGCFPRMSLDNYESRYPCFSLGRNLYYSLVFSMQSQFPGFVEQLAHGLSELATKYPVSYTHDAALGFHVERFVPFPLREKFRRMLAGTDRPVLQVC